MKFTPEERNLLINILGNITVKPLDADAIKSVELVQSIVRKVEANTERGSNEHPPTEAGAVQSTA